MSKVLCIYHKKCLDGFLSAWVVGQRYGYDNVEFVAADYVDQPPDMTDRIVYLVDFSYPPEILLPLAEQATKITIIDHHQTAVNAWSGVPAPANIVLAFNVLDSGCAAVWKWFMNGAPLPRLFEVVQDYDLWKHEITGGRDIVVSLQAKSFMDTEDWSVVSELVRNLPLLYSLIEEGKLLQLVNRTMVTAMIKRNSCMVKFMGYDVPVANIPYEHRDLAGELMCENAPFSITYDDWLSKGIRKISLRSNKEGADVGQLAKWNGGGGHRHAASFTKLLKHDLGMDLDIGI